MENQEIDYKDLYLRKSAEFENYKKRKAKEEKEIYDNTKRNFLLKILSLFDNIESLYNNNQSSEEISSIYNLFRDFLKRENVEEMDILGLKFDHEFSEALAVLDDIEGRFDEEIVKVFLKGYTHKEKILRHAKVGIYKK